MNIFLDYPYKNSSAFLGIYHLRPKILRMKIPDLRGEFTLEEEVVAVLIVSFA